MAVNLNQFGVPSSASDNSTLMPKLQYRFRVNFTGMGNVAADRTSSTQNVISAGRPSITHEEVIVDSYNSKSYIAGKHTWEPISIVLRDDVNWSVIKLIGQPHTKSISNEDNWIYIERVLSKGSYHQLGKNVLKTNNVLILTFNKYGVLVDKNLLNKNDINKMRFTKKITDNNLSKKSFVQSFLSSVKSKMYQQRK